MKVLCQENNQEEKGFDIDSTLKKSILDESKIAMAAINL